VSRIEDVLRRAYTEAAQTVTWADIAHGAPKPERARPARRRRLTVAALAAAAVVVVAIAAAVVAALVLHRTPPASGHRREPPRQQAQPGFFAVLPGSGDAVQIRSALTGRLVAAISPPAKGDFFSGVAVSSANGRTLLLAVERNSGGPCTTWLFKVQLTITGQPTALEPARVPSLAGILPDRAFTAASDGSAIAFADYCQGSSDLEIERLRTGTSVSWPLTPGDQVDDVSLSSNGAALSLSGYEYAGSGPGAKPGTSSVRLRPVTAVLRASAAYTVLDGQGVIVTKFSRSALSSDGKTLYVCTQQGRADVLSAYDIATKALRRNVAAWANSGCSFALDPAGQYALIATSGGGLALLDVSTGRLTVRSVSGLPTSAVLAW
jgi:hypothetical protein